jgi:thioesterase domain-containing protein
VSAGLEPREIEAYLHRRIPITAAMGIRVRTAQPARVVLAAPLAPNVNVDPDLGGLSTGAGDVMVFGGSAAAVAILAAWTLLFVRERAAGGGARLLIQRSSVQYERPITGDFEGCCELADEAAHVRFRRTLDRHGRARITLTSALTQDGARAAAFEGDFVALR